MMELGDSPAPVFRGGDSVRRSVQEAIAYFKRVYGKTCPDCHHKWDAHRIVFTKDGFEAICPKVKKRKKRIA